MKRIITCLSMLCMLVGLAMASPGPKALAASAETTLYGSISTGMRPAGIYSTTTANPPTLTNLAAISTWKSSAGVYANGNYYLLSVLQMGSMVRASKLEKYDVNTWIAINSVDPGTNIPTSLAFNPKDGKTYGCYPTATNGFELGVLDLDKGTTTTVGALDQRYVALFADNGGKVYGIGLDGNLCQFNLETAAATVIGATGVTPSMDVQDACFDESTNTVYWFAHTAYECSLYTIDVNTGAATKVTDFPSYKIRWAGVFAKPAKKVEKPAFIAKMRTEFDKSSLTGKFIFTMPDKTESGEVLTANLSYKFFLNDAEYKTGEGAPGAEVEVPVTVPADGKYKFAVCAELDGASGLTTSIEKYIGQDSPKTPANLKAVKAEGSNEITISWDAVTEGVNGGYINTAAIKYSLVRQPDNVTVASDLTATSFTDKTISAMNNYNYVLMATDGVKSSGAVTSNDVLAGEDLGVALPYENSFLGENGMGFFTTIDANEDGNTWRSNGKNVFYNASKDKDANDWLVSPIVKLEKGKAYHLTMALMVSDLNKQERFEIMYGKEKTAASMTKKVCNEKVTSTGCYVDEWLTADETGLFYIGLHVTSEKNQGALAVSDFKLSDGINTKSPGAATDITVIPGEKGALTSEVEFTCPTKNFSHGPLFGLSKAVVTNLTTGREIATIDGAELAVGLKVKVSDPNPTTGENEYSVVCYNNFGAGVLATAKGWVGPDAPGAPTKVQWVQKGSQTIITWEAPTTGKHGGYVDPTQIYYSVYNAETQTKIKSDLTTCTHVDAPNLSDLQTSLAYVLYAYNDYGTSDPAYSNTSAFGYGYECPLKESFANRRLSTKPWLISTTSGNNVWQLTADLAPNVSSQDGDNGMVGYSAGNPGGARLTTPIIDLSTENRPTIKLWYYLFDTSSDLKITVSNDCGLTWTDVATLPKEVVKKWTAATVDLSAYKTYDHLQIGIEATNKTMASPLFIDNVTVGNTFDNDLAVQSLVLPKSAKAGSDIKASVSVFNNGLKAAGAYKLQCYVNGELVNTLNGSALAADALETFNIDITVPLLDAEELEVKCKVVYADDENKANNEKTAIAAVTPSKYPQPTALKANAKADGNVTLNWAAPTAEYYAERTDDMESYEAWSVGGIVVEENKDTHEMVVTTDRGSLGDYTLIDCDHLATQFVWGAVASGQSIPHLGQGMVCQVIDCDKYGNNSSIMGAHSGNKMLCFWASAQNDDYLILPELAPKNKYISFWAKSLSAKYGLESFDIVVSKSGKEPSDFTVFQSVKNVPIGYKTDPEGGYAFYEFQLPEDTKYVAIHYNAKDVLALLIDDITCTPASNKANLTLEGYNVYRNGVKLNESPVTAATYSDKISGEDVYRYNVTSVFSVGESSFSNTAQVSLNTGIGDNAIGEGRIYGAEGAIVIEGMAGADVAIYTVDGRLVQQVKAEPSTRVAVSKGVYVVKTRELSRAIAVR